MYPQCRSETGENKGGDWRSYTSIMFRSVPILHMKKPSFCLQESNEETALVNSECLHMHSSGGVTVRLGSANDVAPPLSFT